MPYVLTPLPASDKIPRIFYNDNVTGIDLNQNVMLILVQLLMLKSRCWNVMLVKKFGWNNLTANSQKLLCSERLN